MQNVSHLKIAASSGNEVAAHNNTVITIITVYTVINDETTNCYVGSITTNLTHH